MICEPPISGCKVCKFKLARHSCRPLSCIPLHKKPNATGRIGRSASLRMKPSTILPKLMTLLSRDAPGAGMGVAIDLAQPHGIDIGVTLRGAERGVAQQFLDAAQIAARTQQMGGEGMTQRVRCCRFGQA